MDTTVQVQAIAFSTDARLYQKARAAKKDDKQKLYSIHAPEVECIAKGKAHKNTNSAAKSRWRRRPRAAGAS